MQIRPSFFAQILGLLALVAPAQAQVSCASGASPMTCNNPEFRACTIASGGAQRQFCIHEPALPATDVSVIFAFHGGGGEASAAVGWIAKHTEQGMILVAPSAQQSTVSYPASGGVGCATAWRHLGANLNGAFNDMSQLGDPPQCGPGLNGDDLDLMVDLIDALRAQFDIGGYYAMGFSNGAGFVHQLKITQPFASLFSGFAMISAGINAEKEAMVAIGAAPIPGSRYRINGGNDRIARPVMQMFGAEEKPNLPTAMIIQLVDALSSTVPSGDLTGPCYHPDDWNAYRFMQCFHAQPFPGMNMHDLPSNLEATRDWLVAFNRAERRSTESTYPDLGHGTGVDGALTDDTIVVRRDHRADSIEGSAHVAALTIVGGGHAVPGAQGNYAPCGLTRSCDIDALEVILQFWRAHAGLRNLWP
ncbi:MAG: hypothetical protein R8G34_18900 [Paracoccaceae bacterium]|nr:hypothetical protein [Paracoccaceae bacterium]